MARFFEGCVFESRRSQYSPPLEFVYFFKKLRKRPVNLIRIFLISSKTVSIQGKIDTIKTKKMNTGRKQTRSLNSTARFSPGLRGATVARLTPDQKVACSNHVEVDFPLH